MAFSQRDLYQVRREIEKDSEKKCAIIYGGLPPGEEALVCIYFEGAMPGFDLCHSSPSLFYFSH